MSTTPPPARSPTLLDLVRLVQAEPNQVGVAECVTDGNCFFDAIRIALQDIEAYTSCEELRKYVAQSMLDLQDSLTTATLQNWLELYHQGEKERNFVLLEEFKHMKAFKYKQPGQAFTLDERRELYRTLLDKSQYWGEAHAVRIMERVLKVHFIVVDKRTQTLLWTDHHELGSRYFAVLLKSPAHYELLSIRGRYLFPIELLEVK